MSLSLCGETKLFSAKKNYRLENTEQIKIKIISPNKYKHIEVEDVTIPRNFETIHDFQNAVVVFDDMWIVTKV